MISVAPTLEIDPARLLKYLLLMSCVTISITQPQYTSSTDLRYLQVSIQIASGAVTLKPSH